MKEEAPLLAEFLNAIEARLAHLKASVQLFEEQARDARVGISELEAVLAQAGREDDRDRATQKPRQRAKRPRSVSAAIRKEFARMQLILRGPMKPGDLHVEMAKVLGADAGTRQQTYDLIRLFPASFERMEGGLWSAANTVTPITDRAKAAIESLTPFAWDKGTIQFYGGGEA